MASPFTLKRTDGVGLEILYTADNLINIVLDCATPLTPMPLPQMPDTEAILIKVDGNQSTLNITWKVRNLAASPFTVSAAGDTRTKANAATSALQIIEFFKNDFVPVTVSESYELEMDDGNSEILMKGTLQKMTFTISGLSPVVWDVNMQFIIGTVATVGAPDFANIPTFTGMSDSSTTNKIDVSDVATDYFGAGETAITGYRFRYKLSSSSSFAANDFTDIATTDGTEQDLEVEIGAAGTYDVKFCAKTTSHDENGFTVPTEVTVEN